MTHLVGIDGCGKPCPHQDLIPKSSSSWRVAVSFPIQHSLSSPQYSFITNAV